MVLREATPAPIVLSSTLEQGVVPDARNLPDQVYAAPSI